MKSHCSGDAALDAVATKLLSADPTGEKIGTVLRQTLDQLYDGQRTGRYRWDQLYKTEKTHCGTLVEINLQREFGFDDGDSLDYKIAGEEVDCKYSQSVGGWMIPPEAHGRICLLVSADDERSTWSAGLVRTTEDRLNTGGNRDKKATLNSTGRSAICWLFFDAPLPPNVLLQLPRSTVDAIMSMRHGTQRLNALFRSALGKVVGRGVVATVARQDDYMKRVRANGGSRTALAPEGIVILGQYGSHVALAEGLGVPQPGPGESIAIKLARAASPGKGVVAIDGKLWRVATNGDPIVKAPKLPER